MKISAFPALLLCSPALLWADFSYQETTKITGGAMAGMMKMASAFSKKAGQPIESTILVKGNRMAHINPDRASIIDLDKETITNVNFDKKTYSVMTFEQMRQMFQQMTENMKGKNDEGTQVNFKVSSKETGRTQTISGFNTKEVIVTVEAEATNQQQGAQGIMNVTANVWLTADVPGYDEVRSFHKRMAEKLGMFGDAQMAQMRQAALSMVEMNKTMAKMDGIPVRTVMEIGGSATQTGAPSQQQQAQQDDSSNQGGGLGGLARLGGFGHKKKSDQDQGGQDSSSGVLMESTTESSGFSSGPVDDSKFDVPAGFKQVEPQANRHGLP